MKINTRPTIAFTILVAILVAACSAPPRAPDLGGLYNGLAQNEDPYRNPVILIPGILGSKLVDRSSGSIVWGTFGFGNADPKDPSGTRLIALPMAEEKTLSQLQDNVFPSETLDRVVVSFGGYPLILNTYAYILDVLGVGGYRDQQQAQLDVVDWGDHHFTCFQFAYDWRRDIVESAQKLNQFIKEKKIYVETDKVAHFDEKGNLTVNQKGPGDATVLRSSALMDERWPDRQTERLISPINWEQVFFLFSDHRDITDDPVFTDNLLYILLESPRNALN